MAGVFMVDVQVEQTPELCIVLRYEKYSSSTLKERFEGEVISIDKFND